MMNFVNKCLHKTEKVDPDASVTGDSGEKKISIDNKLWRAIIAVGAAAMVQLMDGNDEQYMLWFQVRIGAFDVCIKQSVNGCFLIASVF